ncbi:hypothetical protein [Kaarinaea lacus]
MTRDKRSVEKTVRDICRHIRENTPPKKKTCVVLEGLRGKGSVVEMIRREGSNLKVNYRCAEGIPE